MQEFIKLLGEANRSTDLGWNEGLAIKGSFLYRGTGIFFFTVRLVLMDGLIEYLLCLVPSRYPAVSMLVCLYCSVSKGTLSRAEKDSYVKMLRIHYGDNPAFFYDVTPSYVVSFEETDSNPASLLKQYLVPR
jgi:hypothetical protein